MLNISAGSTALVPGYDRWVCLLQLVLLSSLNTREDFPASLEVIMEKDVVILEKAASSKQTYSYKLSLSSLLLQTLKYHIEVMALRWWRFLLPSTPYVVLSHWDSGANLLLHHEVAFTNILVNLFKTYLCTIREENPQMQKYMHASSLFPENTQIVFDLWIWPLSSLVQVMQINDGIH